MRQQNRIPKKVEVLSGGIVMPDSNSNSIAEVISQKK